MRCEIKGFGLAVAGLLAVGLIAWTPARVQEAAPTTGLQQQPSPAAGDPGPASAGDRALDLLPGELAEAAPDAALVYFLNPWKGKVPILLDDEPLAILPERSFLAVRIVPGVRLVWGWRSRRDATDAEWFEFRPGRTYVLSHPGVAPLGTTRFGRRGLERAVSQASLGWLLEGTGSLSTVWELTSTRPTEADLTSLQAALVKRKVVNPDDYRRRPGQRYRPPPEVFESAYDDAMRVAGRPARARLPAQFKASFTDKVQRPKLFSFKRPGLGRGTLTIADEALRFESKKMSLEVPVRQIRDLCFGGFTYPRPGSYDSSMPLIQLDYEPPGGGDTLRVYFEPAESEHHAVSSLYNPVFAAISEALEGLPAG